MGKERGPYNEWREPHDSIFRSWRLVGKNLRFSNISLFVTFRREKYVRIFMGLYFDDT